MLFPHISASRKIVDARVGDRFRAVVKPEVSNSQVKWIISVFKKPLGSVPKETANKNEPR
jgi:hypothetical protein